MLAASAAPSTDGFMYGWNTSPAKMIWICLQSASAVFFHIDTHVKKRLRIYALERVDSIQTFDA